MKFADGQIWFYHQGKILLRVEPLANVPHIGQRVVIEISGERTVYIVWDVQHEYAVHLTMGAHTNVHDAHVFLEREDMKKP